MSRIQRFISKRKRDIPFWFEIQKRKHTSIFNYERLAQDMELVTIEYPFNAYYGLANVVKKMEGIPRRKRLEASIEHGIRYVDDDIWSDLLLKDTIYIFGNARAEWLRKIHPDKNIVTHRNFLAYVKGMYSSDTIQRLKEKNGKTLLCIPTHSTHHVADVFNQDVLIDKIEKLKEEYAFKTVMVCLYWKDILQGRQVPYVEAGYTVVTAGHIYDGFFLNRLKSILQLSDVVVTNDGGSHVGYAVYEERPVYLFYVPLEHVALDDEVDMSEYGKTEGYMSFTSELRRLFGEYSEEINEEQREFVRAHWGDF